MRRAFTLIEMMISVAIFSIIMLFLYKSHADMNIQNRIYTKELAKINLYQKLKKSLFLDITLAKASSVVIIHQDRDYDILFLQTKHSLYERFDPYVGYIVKDKRLYRVESLAKLQYFPLDSLIPFEGEYIGEITLFRIYKHQTEKGLYFVTLQMKDKPLVTMKIRNF